MKMMREESRTLYMKGSHSEPVPDLAPPEEGEVGAGL
jgi:hypothetical protein